MNIVSDAAVRLLGRKAHAYPGGAPLLAGVAVGMGLMFLVDPSRGKRRRALVRDKLVHSAHRTGSLVDKASRDLGYRLHGLFAEARSARRDERVPDELLVERVRSKIGRAASHPHAIAVRAHDGVVTLEGPIAAREVAELVSRAASVNGVARVENRLEPHVNGGAVPALQGGAEQGDERPLPAGERWSPIARVLLGVAGAALAGYGVARRDKLGVVLGAAGAAILARDIADRPLGRVLGVGAGRRAVDFHKTVHLRAPVHEVFELWSHFETFPRFMSHLHEVQRPSEGRSRWVAAGPAGIPVSWDAELTELVRDRAIAWRSLPGSMIPNAGVVRFEPEGDRAARVDVQMSYNPPGGVLGHAVAVLFGVDPKHAMDRDFVRLQSILERGTTTAHGTKVRFEDVAAKA